MEDGTANFMSAVGLCEISWTNHGVCDLGCLTSHSRRNLAQETGTISCRLIFLQISFWS